MPTPSNTPQQQLREIYGSLTAQCGQTSASTFLCSYLGCTEQELTSWLHAAADIPPAHRKLIRLWFCVAKPLRLKIADF